MLLSHPEFEVQQVTSENSSGQPVWVKHPNLRGVTDLAFCSAKELRPSDCLILALPHGESQSRIDELEALAPLIVDLSSDFRLRDPERYKRFYKHAHACPTRLGSFVNALPELQREELRSTERIAGAGCIATSAITSLWPLVSLGLLDDQRIFIDAKVGSSAAGATATPGSHHPERAGCLRSFSPTGHRHTAEIEEMLSHNLSVPDVYLSATSTDSVRGILTTAQVFVSPDIREADIWGAYREVYGNEPFVRIIKDKRSTYRYPEPKLLRGTNFIDIGFELEPETGRLVVLGAIDNLVKGSAGNVVQALNIRYGFDERLGLEFPGLHPV